ncbi:MAG TPA: hypothetical protein IGS31_14770 [Oscillatoriales cyanobacterium M4454_W2019_049]|nr:hypothetical protein [Oscillatoriales cyanobacterium M4454_W2019_049]
MSARDVFHSLVRSALEKEGWTIIRILVSTDPKLITYYLLLQISNPKPQTPKILNDLDRSQKPTRRYSSLYCRPSGNYVCR